jgi:hypothetical protein
MDEKLFLRNEFATLMVEIDRQGAGPRLRVVDLESGNEIFLDLLELESLTRLTHAHFADLVRPGGAAPTG